MANGVRWTTFAFPCLSKILAFAGFVGISHLPDCDLTYTFIKKPFGYTHPPKRGKIRLANVQQASQRGWPLLPHRAFTVPRQRFGLANTSKGIYILPNVVPTNGTQASQPGLLQSPSESLIQEGSLTPHILLQWGDMNITITRRIAYILSFGLNLNVNIPGQPMVSFKLANPYRVWYEKSTLKGRWTRTIAFCLSFHWSGFHEDPRLGQEFVFPADPIRAVVTSHIIDRLWG